MFLKNLSLFNQECAWCPLWWLWPLLGLLLGLWLAWILWGAFKDRIRRALGLQGDYKKKVDGLNGDLTGLRAERDQLAARADLDLNATAKVNVPDVDVDASSSIGARGVDLGTTAKPEPKIDVELEKGGIDIGKAAAGVAGAAAIGGLAFAGKGDADDEDGSHLEPEPEPEAPSIDAYVGLEDQYVGENVAIDPKYGLLFIGGKPNCADDLTEIKGIGKVLGDNLNEAGIYRFQQIADWNDHDVWAFNEKISFPGRIQRDEWVKQATALAPNSKCLAQAEEAAKAAAIAKAEEDARIAAEAEAKRKAEEEAAAKAKAEEDARIAAEAEAKRKAEEEAAAKAKAEEDARIAAEAEAKRKAEEEAAAKAKAEEDARIAAEADAKRKAEEEAAAKAKAEADAAARAKAEQEAAAKAEADKKAAAAAAAAAASVAALAAFSGRGGKADVDDQLGVVYKSKPDSVDDLTEIHGVGNATEKRLNDYGVYTFRQICQWEDKHVNEFGERLAFPDRINQEDWRGQACRLADMEDERANLEPEPEPDMPAIDAYAGNDAKYAGEDVRVDPKLNVVFNGIADCADDLTEIKGIGKVLNKTLNSNGVYRFQQIADWDDYNVWSFNQIISFPGRIQRDEWVKQATELAPASKCLAKVEEAPAADAGADYSGIISASFAGEDVRSDSNLGVIYNSAPEAADDLTEISDVGDELEVRLNEYGVHRFKQVANWDQNNVDAFGDRLECPGRIEREEWIPQAKKLAEGADASADEEPEPDAPDESSYSGLDAQYQGENVRTDGKLGVLFNGAANCADDLTKIKGIGKVLSKRLNDDGVYRFQQIADWNDYNVWAFNKIISFPGRIQRDEWIRQAKEFAPQSKCLAGNAGIEWPRIPTKEEIGQRAQELSKWRYENQLDGNEDKDWILAERELYRVEGDLKGAPDRRSYYTSGDGRSAVNGLDSATADEFSRLGFTNAESIAGMSGSEKAQVTAWFEGRGMEFDVDGAQAKAKAQLEADAKAAEAAATEEDAYADIVVASFSGEDVRTDQALGVIYNTIPGDKDDLTEIKGVDDSLEERLNDYGVFRFKQIANWDQKNSDGFNERIEFPGRIEREEWIPQAKKLASSADARSEASEEAEPDEKPTEKSYEKVLKQYPGEPVMVKTDLGIVFTSAPDCQDDLTDVSGIGKVLSGKLNDQGVYRFQQIADWNDYNVWAFNKGISFPGRIQREEWISQAKELAPTSKCVAAEGDSGATTTEADLDNVISSEFAGEDVERRDGFGIVYLSAPAVQDNLQDIWGVGPVIEKKLHDFGVYRFKQIANWTDKAVEEFSEQLAFKGRIEREAWIKQAKKLAKESGKDNQS